MNWWCCIVLECIANILLMSLKNGTMSGDYQLFMEVYSIRFGIFVDLMWKIINYTSFVPLELVPSTAKRVCCATAVIWGHTLQFLAYWDTGNALQASSCFLCIINKKILLRQSSLLTLEMWRNRKCRARCRV